MKFQHILEKIHYRPWMITPSAHAALVALVHSKLADSPGLLETLEKRAGDDSDFWAVSRKPVRIDQNSIALIQITGPVGKGLSGIEKSCSGATSVEDVSAELDMAAKRARGVFMYVNSPGGTITGVPELARKISEMKIPVVVYTDDLIASAAYYLSAGAREIWASESAEVGSIGVYIPWIDRSAMFEEYGYKHDPIINADGKLKAIGFVPKLSDEHRAHLQTIVDDSFMRFKEWVNDFRDVPDEAMQGQCFIAEQAVGHNLIDNVGSMEEAYDRLLKLVR